MVWISINKHEIFFWILASLNLWILETLKIWKLETLQLWNFETFHFQWKESPHPTTFRLPSLHQLPPLEDTSGRAVILWNPDGLRPDRRDGWPNGGRSFVFSELLSLSGCWSKFNVKFEGLLLDGMALGDKHAKLSFLRWLLAPDARKRDTLEAPVAPRHGEIPLFRNLGPLA